MSRTAIIAFGILFWGIAILDAVRHALDGDVAGLLFVLAGTVALLVAFRVRDGRRAGREVEG